MISKPPPGMPPKAAAATGKPIRRRPPLWVAQQKQAARATDATQLEFKLVRSSRGLGMDLNDENVIIRVVPDSPASAAGILAGDVVVAVDGVEVGAGPVSGVMDFSLPAYTFRVARVTRSATEMEKLTKDVMDTISLRSAMEAGIETGVVYHFFEGRRLEDGRPEHLVELQAWSVAEVDSTLKRSMMGRGGRGERKVVAQAAQERELFSEIDNLVATLPKPGPPAPKAAAPSAAEASFQLALPSTSSASDSEPPRPLSSAPLAASRRHPASLGTLESPTLEAGARPPADAAPLYKLGADSEFGDLVLQSQIGQGTYGAVWKGTHKGGKVAVKVLPLEGEHAAEVAAEIRLLHRCSCKHIVGYLDTFMRELNGRSALWLVMEHCELGSVLDLMRRSGRPLDEPQVAWVCACVLGALQFMHEELKAIHRDVKAANVLITGKGEVRLGDLGVAAQLFSTMSKRGTMIGTPHWMAPEAFSGEGQREYDNKVDVWGVGILAIECAQNSPPHAEVKELFKVIMAVATGPPPRLQDEEAASDDFRSFLSAALVKNPMFRPTAAELALQPFAKAAPPHALYSLAHEQARALAAQPEEWAFSTEWDTLGQTLAV